MSESAKTYSMIGAAVVLLAVATLTRPKLTSNESEGQINQSLFPDWKDASAAKSLEIASVDETTNSLNDFKVADLDGRWVVPSHDNYPAIAEDKVVKAASSIIGLHVLAVKSDAPGDQELYGVVEPSEKTLTTSGFPGFGRLVVVKDSAGKDLARLIVGKEDKSSAEGGPSNLRFVRRAGQDRIYRVSLDTDVLTTKFQDWVDTDILAMKQPWDVDSLLLRDYALDKSVVRKNDVDLTFDEKANWSIKKLTEFKGNEPAVTKLPPDEELDSSKLNDLKTNLSGLKLVDVLRKPAGFIAKLKGGKDYLGDPEALRSLDENEFFGVPRQAPTDIFSSGGDLTVGMKDGIEYTVRFGGAGVTLKSDSGEKKGAASAKDSKHTNLERVVFVTARFNPDLIPKPELEPLPTAKKPDEKKPAVDKPADNKSEAKKPDEKAPEPKVSEKKPADDKTAPPKNDGGKPDKKPDATKGSQVQPRLSGELLALADPVVDVKKPDDSKKTDDTKKSDDKNPPPANKTPPDSKSSDKTAPDKKADDKKVEDTKPADTTPVDKKADDKKPDAGKPAAEKPKNDTQRADEEAALDAERKRVETDNRRKQDQYDETVKKGKAHAKELNNRFADWYYMIAEDEYKKVHVGLNDIVKKKAGAAAEPGLGPLPQNPFDKGGLNLPHP